MQCNCLISPAPLISWLRLWQIMNVSEEERRQWDNSPSRISPSVLNSRGGSVFKQVPLCRPSLFCPDKSTLWLYWVPSGNRFGWKVCNAADAWISSSRGQVKIGMRRSYSFWFFVPDASWSRAAASPRPSTPAAPSSLSTTASSTSPRCTSSPGTFYDSLDLQSLLFHTRISS